MTAGLVHLTLVPNEYEAEMLCALLRTEGLTCDQRPTNLAVGRMDGMPGGKPWVKLSADSENTFAKSLGEVMDRSVKESDPTKTLDQIRSAGTVTKTEQAQLDGQATTHYWIEIDAAKAVQQSTDGLPEGLANKIAENERASHHAICPVAISAIIRQ